MSSDLRSTPALQYNDSNILIVDDDWDTIQLAITFLKNQVKKLATASTGSEALEKISQGKFDLILLDVQLPDMSGFDICLQLKASQDHCDIPIIFLSAKTSTQNTVHGLQIGAVDYIYKPFNKYELLARVQTHLELRRKTMQLEFFNKILKPYVPQMLLKKADEAPISSSTIFQDEIREVTVLFGDIAGFTPSVEALNPLEAMALLNIALEVPTDAIERNGGFIDKFLGDGVMALFYDPLAAVISAIEIQYLFQELNELRALADKQPILFRIGINTGTVVIGNVGRKNRRDWTAIGDVVNAASRMQRSCDLGGVLINSTTRDKVRENIQIEREFVLHAKGKRQEMQVAQVSRVAYHKNGKQHVLSLNDD